MKQSTMFVERLKKRQSLWWGTGGHWWTPDGLLLRFRRRGLARIHSRDELSIIRTKDDPDNVWHFSQYWQRTLLNKWNSREFAQKYGCKVPDLYSYGSNIAELPLESLPDYYVIRPTWGTGGWGVYVMSKDLDLMNNTHLTKAQLKEELLTKLGEVSKHPLLIEEFVRSEKGEYKLPTTYKFYTFGEKIAAIFLSEQLDRKEDAFHQQLNSQWQSFPEAINTKPPLSGLFEPPECLEEMMSCVKRLGVAFGTFVRIDFYATDKGPIFGEFSSIPDGGKNYTKFGDEYLGQIWDQIYPNKV